MNRTTRTGFEKLTYAQKLGQFKLKYINHQLPGQKIESTINHPEIIPDKA